MCEYVYESVIVLSGYIYERFTLWIFHLSKQTLLSNGNKMKLWMRPHFFFMQIIQKKYETEVWGHALTYIYRLTN